MALMYDTEQQRYIDRIKAVAWREAKEAGATIITRKWIAVRLKRSEKWVRKHWKKTTDECTRKERNE